MVACVLIAILATSCSRTVHIPLEDLESPDWPQPASYRIRVAGGDKHFARRFSLTDSTLVIDETLATPEIRQSNPDQAPTSIPLDRVEAVDRIDTRKKVLLPAIVLGTAGLLVAIFALSYEDE